MPCDLLFKIGQLKKNPPLPIFAIYSAPEKTITIYHGIFSALESVQVEDLRSSPAFLGLCLALATFHRFSVPLLVGLLFLFIPVVIISWPRCLQSCSSFAVFIISAHPLLFPSGFSNLTSKLHHFSPIKLRFSLIVLL